MLYYSQAIIRREGESAGSDKKMLKKLLPKTKSKKKKEAASSAIPTLDRLHETLEMLEKKERFLQKKCSAEIEKAKDYTKSKNKNAAIQCLKKKKLYETQIEQLSNFQLRVHDQIIMLESAKATTDTVDALRSGSSAVKAIQQSVSIDDIESAIEEANEQTENMREIQQALATPVGASADFDEDELEAELEELEEEEEMEEELPEPPARQSAPTEQLVKAASAPKQGSDLSELTRLQAEMAL
ncbi:vacuolar protein sorting-associated protein 32 homolog 2 isoform X1 [Sorghum bicolor]|nr:vacuolar protein sorting-associated protein 32 homolog 2 isoform X1 [Sorghum bicolor]|eukprot:XP_021317453.1 vacuolar protein sorting-associated protein 32 homolog 2 isoform X1 [Sorghum bicolor]